MKAPQVVQLTSTTGKQWPVLGRKLADGYPFIEAEVVYSARNVSLSFFFIDRITMKLQHFIRKIDVVIFP